jgi:hypothetical protein
MLFCTRIRFLEKQMLDYTKFRIGYIVARPCREMLCQCDEYRKIKYSLYASKDYCNIKITKFAFSNNAFPGRKTISS